MSEKQVPHAQSTGVSYWQSIVNSSRFEAELRPDSQPGSKLAPGKRTRLEIKSELVIVAKGTTRIGVSPGPSFRTLRADSGADSVTVVLSRTRPPVKIGDIEITNPPG